MGHSALPEPRPANPAAREPAEKAELLARRRPLGHLVLKEAHHGSLGQAGVRIYRTDRDAAVLLDTDGAEVRVTRWARRDTETLRLASTP
jgi:beta-lactamase superfamily II metal-dependent hydrolase